MHYAGNPWRTSEYPGSGLPGVPRELWRFKGGEVLRPPTLHDGLLVTVDADGIAYGLDTANGMLRWRTRLPENEVSATTFPVTPVWITGTGPLVYGLDPELGEVLATLNGKGRVLPLVEVESDDDTVLTVTWRHVVLRDAADLRIRSELECEGAGAPYLLIAPPILLGNGTAVSSFGVSPETAWFGGLLAYDLASGRHLWQTEEYDRDQLEEMIWFYDQHQDDPGAEWVAEELQRQHTACSLATPPPWADDDAEPAPGGDDWVWLPALHALFAGDLVWAVRHRVHQGTAVHGDRSWKSCELVAFQPHDGDERHAFSPDPLRELRPLGAPAAADGLVYVIFQDLGEPSSPDDPPQAVLHAVDTATGAAVWSRPLDHPPISGPVLAGGLLYLATSEGLLTAHDARTGTLRWSYDLGVALASALRTDEHDQYTEEINPVLPGDGVLYVRTADCSIVALGA